MADYKPLTRAQLCESLGGLFDQFQEWDGLIDCPEDDEGWPKGDSNEANMKRLILDVMDRTSRIIFNLNMRGVEAAPPRSEEE